MVGFFMAGGIFTHAENFGATSITLYSLWGIFFTATAILYARALIVG